MPEESITNDESAAYVLVEIDGVETRMTLDAWLDMEPPRPQTL